MFADDTALFHSDINICRLINTMEIGYLQISVKKTNCSVLHKYIRIKYPLPPFEKKKDVLSKAESTKFFRTAVENHLYGQLDIKDGKIK